MKGFYFTITGEAILTALAALGMKLPEDSRVVKMGATTGANNNFWIMLETDEGPEISPGGMAETRKVEIIPEFDPGVALLPGVTRMQVAVFEFKKALDKFDCDILGRFRDKNSAEKKMRRGHGAAQD